MTFLHAQSGKTAHHTSRNNSILTASGEPVYELSSTATIPYTNVAQLDSVFMQKSYGDAAKRIIAHALKDSIAYSRLQYMCYTFGRACQARRT